MRALEYVLAALALCCASASAQEDPGMYVRGAFNGWSAAHPLRPSAPGLFDVEVRIGPGFHGFKLGSADWSREWVIDPSASVRVEDGRDYPLQQRGGAEDWLLVPQSGRFRFTLDLRDGAARLRVARLGDLASAATDAHAGHAVAELRYAAWRGGEEVARFSLEDEGATLRRYVHSTSAPLRDPLEPVAHYTEYADSPRLRSGNVAFDGLFALAVDDMRRNAVTAIRDDAYDGGKPQSCMCFATGEQWPYVWTRDLAYAAHLGLAPLDPQRVKNGLLFKLSGWRADKPAMAAGSAEGLQIVQDTGTGGSWPVSSDRVSWAYGAAALLEVLQGEGRRDFARTAYRALANTLENDRLAVYDAADGLYRGEQSFLDWREQSYARWITGDLASLASSKALSTNVAHYRAMLLAAQLAHENGERGAARRYAAWAAQLKLAMRARFVFLADGLPSTLIAGHFDGAPLQKHDWLALTLAIEAGVFDTEEARRILSHYPHSPFGPPVIFPQQPDVPVYHNRAIWPFVTAQGLRAAATVKHVAAADAAYASLVRGAALNLSNMENLEWQSGHAMLLDEGRPELSGPVIDSRRQLWSVGAYLGMVVRQVFGVDARVQGLRLAPFLTARLRRELFGDGQARLQGLRLQGRAVDVVLKLPLRAEAEGYYPLRAVHLNGRAAGSTIPWADMAAANVVELEFGALERDTAKLTVVRSDVRTDDPAVQAPAEAGLRWIGSAGLEIVAAAQAPASLRYALYRDGHRIAAGLPAGAWQGRNVRRGCYSVEAVDLQHGLHAHRSAPLCSGLARFIAADALQVRGRAEDWGAEGDTLELPALRLARAGQVHVQVAYRNASNAINLGITSGVKWLTVQDGRGRTVAQGVLVMPHATGLALSTPLSLRLPAGRYRLRLQDFYNMSYLQANARYGQVGGAAGPRNRIALLGMLLRTP